jgi:hypothetical protein
LIQSKFRYSKKETLLQRKTEVQYLAEVKKQSKGFIGGTETKLKLLAFQRNDQSWCAVPGEETLNCEAANNFGEGAFDKKYQPD